MRYTLRQPAHAAAACAGLALLLGACAPITPFARPTPTPTASSPTPTNTPSESNACTGYLLAIEETFYFSPRNRNTYPQYYFLIDSEQSEDTHVYLDGTVPDSMPELKEAAVDADLTIGQPVVAPGVGTFTILNAVPGPGQYGGGTITFCFEPDPSLDVNTDELAKFDAR